jgi:hypothetical protein
MTENNGGYIEVGEAPQDGSWREWREDEFWLVLWLIETTASANCVIPPDADTEQWAVAQGLIDAVQAHQDLRNMRQRQGHTLAADATLIFSREHVADWLDALQADGRIVRFRPSGRRSGIEFAVLPGAR